MEYVSEETFKESIKKKLFFFQDTPIGEENTDFVDKCIICGDSFSKDNNEEEEDKEEQDIAKCPYCKSVYHMLCLAKFALKGKIALIPKEVECLICGRNNIWKEYL